MLSVAWQITLVPSALDIGSKKYANDVVPVTRLLSHGIRHLLCSPTLNPSLKTTQQSQLSHWLGAVKPSGTAAAPQASTPVSWKRKTQEPKAAKGAPPPLNKTIVCKAQLIAGDVTTPAPVKDQRRSSAWGSILKQSLLPVGFSFWQVLHRNQCQASPCPVSENPVQPSLVQTLSNLKLPM